MAVMSGGEYSLMLSPYLFPVSLAWVLPCAFGSIRLRSSSLVRMVWYMVDGVSNVHLYSGRETNYCQCMHPDRHAVPTQESIAMEGVWPIMQRG